MRLACFWYGIVFSMANRSETLHKREPTAKELRVLYLRGHIMIKNGHSYDKNIRIWMLDMRKLNRGSNLQLKALRLAEQYGIPQEFIVKR